jgi:hypothetical protein
MCTLGTIEMETFCKKEKGEIFFGHGSYGGIRFAREARNRFFLGYFFCTVLGGSEPDQFTCSIRPMTDDQSVPPISPDLWTSLPHSPAALE